MQKQIFQYHPVIGYTFIPNIKARIQHNGGGYLIKTNNIGFRDNRDFSLNKNSNRGRILVFGDSYTAGDGVSNGSRYTEILEQSLSGPELYNFGLPASGTDQQYLVFKEFVKDAEYDLIIISVLVENITRVASRYKLYKSSSGENMIMEKPYFMVEKDKPIQLFHNPVSKEPKNIKEIPKNEIKYVHGLGKNKPIYYLKKLGGKQLINILKKFYKYNHYTQYNNPNNISWQTMKAILKSWAKEVQTPVIICPIPTHYHYEETDFANYYQTRFQELYDPPHIIIHDPLDDYLKVTKSKRRSLRFATDVHPTKLQHELLSQSLHKIVSSYF
ncbi:MAG: hypothetical protein SRB1_02014 [Desulfobacteraceae bacterium Eth-SRB1]|nr:MAG: hypothetical protein SRB1_02014 [Desulfobacteraceae bacterium Eth-SRB1]